MRSGAADEAPRRPARRRLRPGQPDPDGRPIADGVLPADKPPRHMGMNALDPSAGSPDAATGPGALPPRRHESVTLSGVSHMRRRQCLCIDRPLGVLDAAFGFEQPDPGPNDGVDQPVAGRHGRAVTQVRFVLDDDRTTVESSHDHGAASRERSTEVLLDDFNIGERRVAETQRQNSRVRTRRERNAFADEWCFAIDGEFAATNDDTDDGETRGCSPGSPVL